MKKFPLAFLSPNCPGLFFAVSARFGGFWFVFLKLCGVRRGNGLV